MQMFEDILDTFIAVVKERSNLGLPIDRLNLCTTLTGVLADAGISLLDIVVSGRRPTLAQETIDMWVDRAISLESFLVNFQDDKRSKLMSLEQNTRLIWIFRDLLAFKSFGWKISKYAIYVMAASTSSAILPQTDGTQTLVRLGEDSLIVSTLRREAITEDLTLLVLRLE